MRGILVFVIVILAGCTAPQPADPTPTPTVVAMPEPVVVSGIGEQSAVLSVPSGAGSLLVRLACTNGRYLVAANMDFDASGGCGGAMSFAMPLPKTVGMPVTIYVDADATVLAEFTFSPEQVDVDDALAADCDALGQAESHFYNADAGLRAGDIDAAEWRERMDEGVAVLSGHDATPLFADQVAKMLDWAANASDPGTAQDQRPNQAAYLMSVLCGANYTPVKVMAEYGG